MARGLPYLAPIPERAGAIAIVGGGPSITDQIETIRHWDGPLWAIHGVLPWLIGHGIVPDAMVMLDAQPKMVGRLPDDLPDIDYYIASTCDAGVLDRLAGRRVFLWHQAAHDLMPPSGHYAVPGGPTCLTHCPSLAHMLGWRDIHVFGADSSFREATHGYGGSLPPDTIRVRVGEQVFLTNSHFMQVAAWQVWFRDTFPARLTYHGEGLTRALDAAPMQDAIALLGEAKPDNAHLVAKETPSDATPQI